MLRSAIKPRCAYFSGFKRFSRNGQKVNEKVKTEATVTSEVKNWYIIFLFRNFWIWEMPIGDKNVIIFLKFRFFAFKVPLPPFGFQKICPGDNRGASRPITTGRENGRRKRTLTRRQVGGFFEIWKHRIFRKIGQKLIFNSVWADLDSGFEFSLKNPSYLWAQTITSSCFDIRLKVLGCSSLCALLQTYVSIVRHPQVLQAILG